VEFRFLLLPVAFAGDGGGRVTGARFQQASLGAVDRSGRREPVAVEGAYVDLECRQVVLALGNRSSGWWRQWGLEGGEKGPRVDAETMETSRPGVFAGGDLVRGGATVVQAVADGRKAARAMAQRVLG
jgi:glutamate synthase (NADPH/NADH) small chain